MQNRFSIAGGQNIVIIHEWKIYVSHCHVLGRLDPPPGPLCREGNEKLSNKNKLNHLQEKSVKNFVAFLKAEGNFAKSRK
jgi:hypothetical protein